MATQPKQITRFGFGLTKGPSPTAAHRARTMGARFFTWRKENRNDPLFASPPRNSHLSDIVQRTLAQAQAFQQGGRSAALAHELRAFGEAVAARRRARRLTRAEATHHSKLDEREIAFIEWGLLAPEEVRGRLDDIAAICGAPVDEMVALFRDCALTATDPIQQASAAEGVPVTKSP